MQNKKIVIVGAGLVGCLWAIFLAKRGYTVEIYEKRSDPRLNQSSEGRSINLILTSRGLKALELVGLKEKMLELAIPVKGRMMHDHEGNLNFQSYGIFENECNFSISRSLLNCALLDETKNHKIFVHFDHTLFDTELDERQLYFNTLNDEFYFTGADIIFGADGSGSILRKQYLDYKKKTDHVEFLSHSYKEYLLPADERGNYQLDPNSLHIWARKDFFLMALANLKGSFTLTLYMEHDLFKNLDDEKFLHDFFKKEFGDIYPLITNLSKDNTDNPVGKLGTVYLDDWGSNNISLIGDASHGIVPFFGQGMNSGFEDLTYLHSLLEEHNEDWEKVLKIFNETRSIDTNAIAKMALENFVEMQAKVVDENFLLQKSVEKIIEKKMPEKYRSRYSLVTYSLIPYSKVIEIGKIQKDILDQVCKNISSESEVDLSFFEELIDQKLTPFLKRNKLNLDFNYNNT